MAEMKGGLARRRNIRQVWRMRIILALLLLCLAAQPGRAAESYTNADLLRHFDVVAFGNEMTGKRFDIVRKWGVPVRIGLFGTRPPPYLDTYVENTVGDLRRITGHPIELYYATSMTQAGTLPGDIDVGNVNVVLFYGRGEDIPAAVGKFWKNDPDTFRRLMQQATCFANYSARQGEIVSAVVVIPASLPESFVQACVVEELTQILGLPNDSNEVSPSIFNDTSRYFDLTGHDRWLLRALYQTDIVPGMAREEALKRVSAYLRRARRE